MTALATPSWMEALRAAGAARFAESGLPTQRQEAWKYTGLNRLKSLTFEPTPGEEKSSLRAQRSNPEPFAQQPGLLRRYAPRNDGISEGLHQLTFVDGRFDAAQSSIKILPAGVILASLANLLKTQPGLVEPLLGKFADLAHRPMVALNTAWIADGLVLIVPRGVTVAEPIAVTYLASGAESPVSYPRHIISLGENAAATIVEHHAGGGFADAVSEITLAAGSSLGHYVVHAEPAAALAVENAAIRLGRDASYRGFGLTAGGGLVRRDIEVLLDQPGASARLDGAYLVDGGRHADTTIFVDHKAPNCQSRQTQKGVIDGDGRAVFQGKILVRPGAQKTDGAQLSQTLLLSPDAEIDVKPELEIHADDVKCSHGATVGRLDMDALFFLRARGIPEPQARALLIEGFIGGALDEIAHPLVREAFAGVAAAWLHEHSSPELRS